MSTSAIAIVLRRAAPMAREVLQERAVLPCCQVRVEAPVGRRRSRQRPFPEDVRIGQVLADGHRELLDIARRHEASEPPFIEDLVRAGDAGSCDAWRPDGQCLDEREREALPPTRQDEDVSSGDDRMWVRDESREGDGVLDPQVRSQCLEARSVGSLAQDHHVVLAGAAPQGRGVGSHEDIEALLVRQAAGGHDEGHVRIAR